MSYTQGAGARIYWDTSGAGEPLLLIQGLGYTTEMWYRIRPALAARFSTIALDNRGVGRSDVPPGPYAIATMAADAIAALDAAGVERAHVFGVSLGGMIAQELALRHPKRVRSLVLGCTACGGPRAVPASPIVLSALGARTLMTRLAGAQVLVPYIYDRATPATRIEEDLAVRLQTYPSNEGYVAQLKGAAFWQSYSRLGQIRAPTLVIHGANDQLIPPQNGRVIAKAIPGAQLRILAQASHIFFTDQPEASCSAILEFLEMQP
ncbi:MAG: alpha/beta fold hydrolase [Chloroflexales bacterium]|nr:alpha/beta fold hydrolase [Chloroflexales bacterium]